MSESNVVIVASYGPSMWDRTHHCTVRGVPVHKLRHGNSTDDRGVAYCRCVFPDGRVMLVNEGNIRVKKLNRSEYSVAEAA